MRVVDWITNEWPKSSIIGAASFSALSGLWHGVPHASLVVASVVLSAVGGVGETRRKPSYTDLLNELEDHRDRATEQIALSQDLLRALLLPLAQALNLDTSERISLYVHDRAAFVMLARHSANPEFAKSGQRSVYPESEGVIGEAWRNKQHIVFDLPDPEADLDAYLARLRDDYRIPEGTGRAIRMKSRSLLGLRYPDGNLDVPLGVAIIESTDPDRITSSMADIVRESLAWKTVCTFAHIYQGDLPAMSEALGKGF